VGRLELIGCPVSGGFGRFFVERTGEKWGVSKIGSSSQKAERNGGMTYPHQPTEGG